MTITIITILILSFIPIYLTAILTIPIIPFLGSLPKPEECALNAISGFSKMKMYYTVLLN